MLAALEHPPRIQEPVAAAAMVFGHFVVASATLCDATIFQVKLVHRPVYLSVLALRLGVTPGRRRTRAASRCASSGARRRCAPAGQQVGRRSGHPRVALHEPAAAVVHAVRDRARRRVDLRAAVVDHLQLERSCPRRARYARPALRRAASTRRTRPRRRRAAVGGATITGRRTPCGRFSGRYSRTPATCRPLAEVADDRVGVLRGRGGPCRSRPRRRLTLPSSSVTSSAFSIGARPLEFAEVPEHQDRGADHGRRVDHVLAGVLRRRAVHRLEDGHFVAEVGRRREARARRSGREVRSLMMSPFMFVVTITSNCSGFLTSWWQQLSTMMCQLSMSGYSLAISSKVRLSSALGHLHDVRLGRAGDLLAALGAGELERQPDDLLAALAGDELQALRRRRASACTRCRRRGLRRSRGRRPGRCRGR